MEEKRNRTILLPKDGDLKLVENWRPLTIGSSIARLYAKVWDTKLQKCVPLNCRQKAFVPLHGCFQNVQILQGVVKMQKLAQKELNLVFLDLLKAFDTVQHQSIAKALTRKGMPELVVKSVLNMYEGATTSVKCGGVNTRTLAINNGVQQGCPLSPFLFNLVLDELLECLERTVYGVLLQDQAVSSLAVADDLVLMAPTEFQISELMLKCEEFYNEKGLSVNAKKSQSLRVLPVKDKVSMKVVMEVHRFWKSSPIPSIGLKRLAQYLGVRMDVKGNIVVSTEACGELINRLRRAPLKPYQRVAALREVLIPRLLHQLRLANLGKGRLKAFDRVLRGAFKEFSHLPQDTSSDGIHLWWQKPFI